MFKNPFSFEGRIRRMEYGLSLIIYFIFYGVILALADAGGVVGALIILALFIPIVWFIWAQGAKRCHDIGKSGWMQIIPFYLFFLLFENGEYGVNSYGVNPKDPNQVIGPDAETLDGHLIN